MTIWQFSGGKEPPKTMNRHDLQNGLDRPKTRRHLPHTISCIFDSSFLFVRLQYGIEGK